MSCSATRWSANPSDSWNIRQNFLNSCIGTRDIESNRNLQSKSRNISDISEQDYITWLISVMCKLHTHCDWDDVFIEHLGTGNIRHISLIIVKFDVLDIVVGVARKGRSDKSRRFVVASDCADYFARRYFLEQIHNRMDDDQKILGKELICNLESIEGAGAWQPHDELAWFTLQDRSHRKSNDCGWFVLIDEDMHDIRLTKTYMISERKLHRTRI